MSTRLYPVFKEGSPKLRVFLPNFWMKCIKPTHNLLPNQVQFIVSPQMTRFDVQQYLEKIYNVSVVNVALHNQMGKTKTVPNSYITKEPDQKIAYVTLAKDQKFEFPQIFGTEEADAKAKESQEQFKALYEKKTKINVSKQGIPSWFSY